MLALPTLRTCGLALGLSALLAGAAVHADDFSTYEIDNAATFFLPQGSPNPENRGPAAFDVLADGRILVLTTALPDPFGFTGVPEVYVETAVGSRTWDYLGDLPLASGASWPSFGAAFLSVSPDGSRVAVGDNNFGTQRVGVFSTADLLSSGAPATSVDWYEVPHFIGEWADNRHLAINYGAFGQPSKVSLLDTDSPVGTPVNPDLIVGIGGGSAAVAFDADGNLYTANGFDGAGASNTGDIRVFPKAGAGGWQEALDNAVPLNFESQGSFYYSALSATSLDFDNEGNLFVGGSDFFGSGEADFLALKQNPANGAGERMFDPDTLATSFYNVVYNRVTGELYANQPFPLIESIDNTAVYVIAPVPEPSSVVLLATGLAGLAFVWRKKRRP